MSNQQRRENFQGGFGNKAWNEYEFFQNKILDETGVECSVLVGAKISIKCKEYADYILARKVIAGSVSKEIIWTPKLD